MAKAKALAELSDTDLEQQLLDSKEELFNLRFQFATGQLENSARLKTVKKEIARVHTELRAREIAAAESLEDAALATDGEGA
ncbi:MAG: 50S ribosomal protein L29 [Actinomycetota bacterium]